MKGIFGDLYGGYPVVINNDLVEERQVKFPRAKRKRIKKKFKKDKRNWKDGFPFTGFYFIKSPITTRETIVLRQETLDKIIKQGGNNDPKN